MNFFDRLQSLMDSMGLTQKALAESAGIRQANISEWKKNGNLPSGETAIKIANYFNVSLDYLLTGNDSSDLPPDEIELLSNYRNLTEDQKAMISIQIAAIAATN